MFLKLGRPCLKHGQPCFDRVHFTGVTQLLLVNQETLVHNISVIETKLNTQSQIREY